MIRSALLLALALSAPAADLQLPTAFEVRRDLTELLADLAKAGPGDEGPLLERAATLLAAHGHEPAESPDGARPIGAIVADALARARLQERYVALYGDRARQALEACPPEDLARRAAGYPGTAAAQAAWKRLADHAWDLGRPGLAAEAHRAAGPNDPAWAARGDLARRLAVPAPAPMAPARLGVMTRAWSLTAPLRSTTVQDPTPRRKRRNEVSPSGFVLGHPQGEATILSDGQHALVVDHLLGRVVGETMSLGNQPPSGSPPRPAAVGDGWVAVGVQDQRLRLMRCDRQGSVRWSRSSGDLGYGLMVSSPVILDGLVLLALEATDGEAAEVRVMAWRLADGQPAWSTQVGRFGGIRAWGGGMRAGGGAGLVVHDGALILVSNFGSLVRLASDGRVERVWTYRKEQPALGLDDDVRTRAGSLVSDGHWLVAAPADQPGTLLLLAGNGDPVTYRGDGAGGDVLATAGGTAWIGGSRLMALDLERREVRWDAPLAAAAVQAGRDSLLVTSRDSMTLLAQQDGTVLDRLTTTEPVVATATEDGWLVTVRGSEEGILMNAWGDPGPARERLKAAVATGSWNAAAALASLSTGGGQDEEAVTWYLTALRLGAPAEYARRCAGLLRRAVEQTTDPQARQVALDRLAILVGHDPGLAGELALRQAQAATDPAQRAAALARARAAPAGLVDGPNGVAVDVRLLAACLAGEPPHWSTPPLTPPATGTPWRLPGRRTPGSLLGGGAVVGYADGVLTAVDARTGVERWWRRPGRPLLGVQSGGDARGDGVLLATVLPGSAAATAGLMSGDVLLRLNDRDMHSFTGDLMPTVLALGVRGKFTAVVRRGADTLTCTGVLGGELVQPVAIDERTVLVWPAGLLRTGGQGRLAPEGLWVEAFDLTSGERRWRQAIAPATADGGPAAPLLVGGLAILADGPDLLARRADNGAEQWRLAGAGDLLARSRRIGSLLWLGGESHGILLDPTHGEVLARVTGPGSADAVAGTDLFISDRNDLRRIDVAQTRQAWTAEGIARVVAVAGDAVWAVSAAGPLVQLDRASGRERRRYGDWPAVAAERVVGETLVLQAGAGPGKAWVAGVALAGGAVSWSLGVPPGCDVLSIDDDGAGPAVVVGDQDGPVAVIHLDSRGNLRGMTPVAALPGTRVIPTADGCLRFGPDCAERLAMEALGAGAKPWVPGTTPETLTGLGRLGLTSTTGGYRLQWTPEAPSLALAIADAGESLAAGGVRVQVSDQGVLTGDSAGTPWTVLARREGDHVVIDLITTRLAGAPLLMRVDRADRPDPRWWWTRTWRLVAGAR